MRRFRCEYKGNPLRVHFLDHLAPYIPTLGGLLVLVEYLDADAAHQHGVPLASPTDIEGGHLWVHKALSKPEPTTVLRAPVPFHKQRDAHCAAA